MYADRLRTLMKAYKAAERNNATYQDTRLMGDKYQRQLDFLMGLHVQIDSLSKSITQRESEWRESILSMLEAEITADLARVYPTDGYRVKLSSRVLRGKIHIDAKVYSFATNEIPGKIRGTQGRLFQQVVSFAALKGVMTLLGVKTLYVDEAFSGSSKRNIKKLNGLLAALQEQGHNLVLIAQDTSMADGIPANRLFLSRSIDNKTMLQQRGVNQNGYQD